MRLFLVTLLLALLAGCASSSQHRPDATGSRSGGLSGESGGKRGSPRTEVGYASFYADSLHGRRTANGQRYDRNAPTCAHRTHRFGTYLEVTVMDSGRSAVCRVNDRGPFVKGRIVDVSKSLARELGFIERGVTKVRVKPVK